MCILKGEEGLSFRDLLHTFNMAILAKQSWQIMQDEKSLIHNIFKAKYFPHVFHASKFRKSTILYMARDLGGSLYYS